MAAGLVFVGEEIGLAVVFADTAGAAFAEGSQVFFHAGADVEESGAEGTEQRLVARGGEKIDVVHLHINRHMPGGLGGIDNERDSMLARDPADLADRLNGAGYI